MPLQRQLHAAQLHPLAIGPAQDAAVHAQPVRGAWRWCGGGCAGLRCRTRSAGSRCLDRSAWAGGARGTEALNVGVVCRLFPATKPANIARYLPYVEAALGAAGLTDRAMVLGALGTIRAETEGFVPISEFQSKYNTPPGGAPFSLYDTRRDIGNSERGDGARYRGRGFVQLTGKSNYQTYQSRLEVALVATPDLANAPEVAAVVLAQFLLDKAARFRTAVAAGDLRAARRLVNGGAHGLAMFKDVFERAHHRCRAGQHNGLCAHRAGLDYCVGERVAFGYRLVDEIHQ